MKNTIREHSSWKRLMMFSLLVCIGQLLCISKGYSQQVSGTSNADVPKTISYQGMITLADGSAPQDGTYPIIVSLYADENGSSLVWRGTYSTAISRGTFNIILGSGNDTLPAPSMMNRPIWVGVSFNGSSESHPLSQLTAAPYALNVPDQSISASKISANYVGSISVNGETVTRPGSNLNLVGNGGIQMTYDSTAGTLLLDVTGTTGAGGGNKPLWIGYNNFNVDGTLNVTPDYTNVIGGGSNNTANPYGPLGGTNGYASILGGTQNTAGSSSQYDVVSGGSTNQAIGGASSVGGGVSNVASGHYSEIGGGTLNISSAIASYVGGGYDNQAIFKEATVAGGYGNTASELSASVGGGAVNTASAEDATVSGGDGNTAAGEYSAISGGEVNSANGSFSAIAGGQSLTVGSNSFGFNNLSSSVGTTDVSGFTNPLAYFGNVDLDVGNTDGTARSLILWGNNTSLTYTGTGAGYSTSFNAGNPSASVMYVLPSAAPSSATDVLAATNTTSPITLAWQSAGGGWALAGNTITSSGNWLGTNGSSSYDLFIESEGTQVATFIGSTGSVILGSSSNSTSSFLGGSIGGGPRTTGERVVEIMGRFREVFPTQSMPITRQFLAA